MKHTRIAILVCTNVIGGHEFQSSELARSLAKHALVTVFVNRSEHAKLFVDAELDVQLSEGMLLKTGWLPMQFTGGFFRRHTIRELVNNFDQVIVCAGAVEAGVAVGVALSGYKPISMYLPFFYDRVAVWGWKGYVYNCILARTCRLFNRIITINRIQARVIRAFSGVPTCVVTNKVREVKPPVVYGPARLLFVGRLDHQKRVDELMHWLDSVTNPLNELVLIGDGPLRQELEDHAKTLTYLKCTFLGWKDADEQDKLFHLNDILVINSLLEGEPLVVREARIRGLNIVARHIVGTRGVTSRNERFRTQDQLLSRLKTIACQSIRHKSASGVVSISRSEAIRDRYVEELVRTLKDD